MGKTILAALAMVLISACSEGDRVGAEPASIDPLPGLEFRGTAAEKFRELASKGPVPASACVNFGGVDLKPKDYEDPFIIAQGLAIYKPKQDQLPSQLGVSFVTSNSSIVKLHTCSWPIEVVR